MDREGDTMNNKGYTLVEIMAAVTILGIISVLAFGGYIRYADSSRKKAYDIMAKSASNAAEQYIMDNPGAAVETKRMVENGTYRYEIKSATAPGISLEELIEDGYLNDAVDPEGGKNHDLCDGKVTIGLVESEAREVLDRYIFVVDLCCSQFSARYTYTYEDQPYTKNGETLYKSIFKESKNLNTAVCS